MQRAATGGGHGCVLHGKHNVVAAIRHRNSDAMAAEGFLYALQMRGVCRVVTVQIDHHDPLRVQHVASVVIEGLAAELFRLAVWIKSIDQHHVKRVVGLVHEMRTICTHHAEPRIVRRDLKAAA